MYIFYLIAVLFSGIFQHNTALYHYQHQEHIAHVRHIEYLAFISRESKPAPTVPPAISQPIATPSTSPAHTPPPAPTYATLDYYSCSALESFWIANGGNPSAAFIAAQIATAESGGNPKAISPTSDYGLWQINSSNAPGGEMLDPVANVHEAILLSGNGTNWSPWTTYTSGIYATECLA